MSEKEAERVECPDCDGDGEQMCSCCDGTGYEDCDRCSGEGEIDAEDED